MTTLNPEIYKQTLKRPGFHDMIIRKRKSGEWEWLSYVDNYGGEKWKPITGFSEEDIEKNIKEYGEK